MLCVLLRHFLSFRYSQGRTSKFQQRELLRISAKHKPTATIKLLASVGLWVCVCHDPVEIVAICGHIRYAQGARKKQQSGEVKQIKFSDQQMAPSSNASLSESEHCVVPSHVCNVAAFIATLKSYRLGVKIFSGVGECPT